MWDTPAGIRKFQGRERDLFIQAALSLHEHLSDAGEDGGGLELDIPAFDHISLSERLAVLLHVAGHILGDGPAPAAYAWNEASIAAVYFHIEVMIELEIDAETVTEPGEDPVFWRRLVHEAWMDRCFPASEETWKKGEGNKQSVVSRDCDHWCFKVRCLAGEVLEDDDYAMDYFMDVSPGRAAGMKDFLGIPVEYFTQAPPAFSHEEVASLDALRRALLAEGSGI